MMMMIAKKNVSLLAFRMSLLLSTVLVLTVLWSGIRTATIREWNMNEKVGTLVCTYVVSSIIHSLKIYLGFTYGCVSRIYERR
jgi:hypothetical protein